MRSHHLLSAAVTVASLYAVPAVAGITVFDQDGKSLEFGAHIQYAGAWIDDDVEGSQSDLFFRRLRPYISATIAEQWEGRVELDFGKTLDDDEVQVKDAYIAWLGWEGMKLEIGNTKTPFSREFLTSSKRQQTIERGFVGDHNFGTPDRQMGLRLSGGNADKTLNYMVAIGGEDHDPDVRRMDFDSPANTASDWNEGIVAAGRLDWHPWGYVPFDQGDFAREDWRANFSVAAFHWTNDDDSNTYTGPGDVSLSATKADLDQSSGIELSTGIRGHGVSVDIEYQRIMADTVVDDFTGGIYRNGSTDLDKLQVEGGYLLPGDRWELAAKYEFIDADNYADEWSAYEVGVNYFFRKHDVKLQLGYRHGDNVFGESGRDADAVLAMMQLAF